ncbi:MAG: hypothetical protein KDN20_16315 [Verrucomicrobiae bacterium]|nr:hypothetical protein [Verrucomicrobiae bacterium]
METPDLSQSAQENLRTIRQLMERATVYRAISAGPALVGGILSLALGMVMMRGAESMSPVLFVGAWLAVLVIVDALNTVLLWREARNRGAAFPSRSTLHGIKALAPAMLAGGVTGLVFALRDGDLVRGVLMWTMGYGLGLLATGSFAPRSIRALGWAFLVAGLGWFLFVELGTAAVARESAGEAGKIMAMTFGAFHLVYAVRTGWWKRDSQR